MEQQALYAMLELAFANIHNITTDDINLYDSKLKELLPMGWYTLSTEDRIAILDEAIRDNKQVTETEVYKNLIPKGTHSISK